MQYEIRDYKDLDVWKLSRQAAVRAYVLARQLPDFERYALADQLRRAAISVSANIAEGCGRGTRREMAHFLRIARGSLAELETLVFLTQDLGYRNTDIQKLKSELHRMRCMINALIGALRRDRPAPVHPVNP